jgi:peptide/nickel transport system ATP-binding protein
VAIVGESGSGKTTLSRILAGLLAPQSGEVVFQGKELPSSIRSRSPELLQSIQYVFQNPYGSLNPRKSVGEILARPLAQFGMAGRGGSGAIVEKTLDEVGLSADLIDSYPQDLSGGERQRVAIARALVGQPKLLICDEVTSALDVSAQAGIVALLRRLVDDHGLAILFVTHDLALVRSMADRCAVLEKGSIVETGVSATVIDSPSHQYTRELIADTPIVSR